MTEILEVGRVRRPGDRLGRRGRGRPARVRPDVLVSDIGMPGEDGYALMRRLRSGSDPWSRQVPALAVSAYAREEDRIRSLAVGFQMHITKPFDPLDLTAAVGHLLRRAPAAVEEHGSARLETGAPCVLIVEDDGDLREGLRQLLESSGYRVEVADNGLDGAERAIACRPQVALIDIGLPRLDGFGVAERIRQSFPRGGPPGGAHRPHVARGSPADRRQRVRRVSGKAVFLRPARRSAVLAIRRGQRATGLKESNHAL